ncbi:hypothetical protein SAMN05216303_103235 [Rhodoferax sp. OV413]|uniref:hypothetical protein n=1 Tax=Rhodoferax sp. OV413 TaxID=1855285 RepID=UPI00089089CE|nr:hypothetical protein [Rhodoferax sp. OV413]SDP16674.1 hypothetical protein SAMN05216303_103235 [Rhodoferax sp. OV413]
MKLILTAAVWALASGLVMAQDAPKKPPVKAAAAKAAPKEAAKPTSSRIQLKSAAKNVAAGIEAAEEALTPAEMAIAERVQVGTVPCELGASVTLVADAKYPGYFNVQVKNLKYRMFPVATSTGAIRLEDKKAGAVWLQLGNKSMLMNQKLGQRLADECQSPEQVAVAEMLKTKPAQSMFDAPAKPPVEPASAPAATTTP